MADIRETTDTPTHTTIIERKSSGGTVLLAIVLLIAVIVGGAYLFNVQKAQTSKDNAIAGAATSVSKAADKVGSAVDPSSK